MAARVVEVSGQRGGLGSRDFEFNGVCLGGQVQDGVGVWGWCCVGIAPLQSKLLTRCLGSIQVGLRLGACLIGSCCSLHQDWKQ